MSTRVLDACCGSRMFWFDRCNPESIFMDKRTESHTLKDSSSANGSRELIIEPDLVADFTAMPFPDETFALVVFDPPHLVRLRMDRKKNGRRTGENEVTFPLQTEA